MRKRNILLVLFLIISNVVFAQFDGLRTLASWPTGDRFNRLELISNWVSTLPKRVDFTSIDIQLCASSDSIQLCLAKTAHNTSIVKVLWTEVKSSVSEEKGMASIASSSLMLANKVDSIALFVKTGLDWPDGWKVSYPKSYSKALFPCCEYFKWHLYYKDIDANASLLQETEKKSNSDFQNRFYGQNKDYLEMPREYINMHLSDPKELLIYLDKVRIVSRKIHNESSSRSSLSKSKVDTMTKLLSDKLASVYNNASLLKDEIQNKILLMDQEDKGRKVKVDYLFGYAKTLRNLQQNQVIKIDSLRSSIKELHVKKEKVFRDIEVNNLRIEFASKKLDSLFLLCSGKDGEVNCPSLIKDSIAMYHDQVTVAGELANRNLSENSSLTDNIFSTYNFLNFSQSSLDSIRAVRFKIELDFEEERGLLYEFLFRNRHYKQELLSSLATIDTYYSELRLIRNEVERVPPGDIPNINSSTMFNWVVESTPFPFSKPVDISNILIDNEIRDFKTRYDFK